MADSDTSQQRRLERRRLFKHTAAAAAGVGFAVSRASAEQAITAGATNGNINQSVAFWCFNAAGDKWSAEKTCQVAKQLGCRSVELIGPEHWDLLKKYGLVCALSPNGMPTAPFIKAFNNPRYHDQVVTLTKKAIDDSSEAGFPSVIAFTGYLYRDTDNPNLGSMSREEAADHCVEGLKRVVGHAEKKGVNVCLEHLNTRDNTHPMKGHPGYHGDNLDEVAEIIRRVDSPNLKLLFDIYHVQVMHGDIQRRLDENKDIIGHVHTAGCPGRGELDDTQEVQYAPIMHKLLDIGYVGYVGQEFIPTRDPLASLRQAVKTCDV
ncbi:Hydroxypyruvate isomerase [Planctomycetes bacterium Pan216]|uniref:Hydroxypyruvate isomerase n=1 Tax=Kolteria novifilia TaxID=2527975 RepID=A0A518B933_9BACT|nr:Hydroxypyruvate isomerase [Planctomycetes bacterium Pan216]